MAGYAFAKLRFRGREAIFKLLLGALVIPGQVAMLPLFLMLKPLGLVNTYGGAIVPAMASVFGIFLVRQFARGIPDDLLEAARIDGASEFRIFLHDRRCRCSSRCSSTLGDLQLPRQLERLHVAADRAHRRRAAHAAGRARRRFRASTCRTTS